ncbi:hypothetical protein [Massilia sp. CFBP9026]|uniref:hypothetical protein n=1 Tax=Massilia sp. CFBP9026 TaxID=3096536 RepID=UPI002A6A8A7D|nr:hypothetical protein [Massilia sp. CFBP9026]MDY0965432.1 hypothetical protein [Massilia sp. CFBP9026]
MKSYVTYDAVGRLTGGFLQEVQPEHEASHIEVHESVRINWTAFRATSERTGVEPIDTPVDDAAILRAKVEKAIAQTYSDVDAVTFAAVGNRAEEYKDAEAAARAFAAAGYVGDVDVGVASYAQFNPTGQEQNLQWAADQIIQRADVFAQAKLAMRTERFAHQAAMRSAANADELGAAVSAWDAFIAATRTSLGV